MTLKERQVKSLRCTASSVIQHQQRKERTSKGRIREKKGGKEGGRVERRGVGRGGHEMRWEEQSDDRNKNKNDNKREKIRRCGRVRRT